MKAAGRRRMAFWVAVAVGSLAIAGARAQAPGAAAPNIVFILVDDLGQRDLACYGSSLYETPNIDRLAREGMRFTQAYAAAPVCSPTRASILTGKSPARLHLTDWIPGARYPRAPLKIPDQVQRMELEETTLAEALGAAGYAAWHVGKWHLGEQPSHYPLAQGFDVNIGGHSKGQPGSYFHPYRGGGGGAYAVENMPPGGEEGDYLTDRLTSEAIGLIENRGDRPFFLHLAYYTVHTPLEGKPELVQKYRRKLEGAPGALQRNAVYAAMVESLDENMGRLMEALEREGIAEETVVIFYSDNGGNTGPTQNGPLRAGKGHLYEGGVRVPLIVRWPGRVAAGSVCDEVVTSVDMYPTLTAIAGVDEETPAGGGRDGVDLAPLWDDAGATLGREAIYFHYPHYHTPTRPPCGAIRRGDFKLIEFYEDGRLELYNLRSDPGENENLAGSRPALAGEMRGMLRAWLEASGAQMPEKNPNYDPDNPFGRRR